jgi:protocatechuate 3,4-dioxygenase beta subunit
MDNDDLPVGRVHSRREILALFGISGAALVGTSLAVRAATGGGSDQQSSDATQVPGAATTTATMSAAAASSICVVTPEETEGPYFVDELLYRSDIRTDPADGTVKDGVPLQLTFAVMSVSGGACTPLAGATVDIWHCDALGVYSDVQAQQSVGKKFLRGTQVTDASGIATFTTIYPGWYQGRAVHIHFKVRTDPLAKTGKVLTSQLFFDDALTDTVYTQAPYASRGQRDTPNSRDNIYASGGDQLLLTLTQDGDGYTTVFNVGMNLT